MGLREAGGLFLLHPPTLSSSCALGAVPPHYGLPEYRPLHEGQGFRIIFEVAERRFVGIDWWRRPSG